ncbi:MAG: glycosyltransferase family 2 protein [Lachnospiraceae bacterium]|nr:glycosyltransferase family 2 protein [Lachnospiraceae bacterium]
MPDISVIVPVYNVESYLAECLDSLTAQTYQNMEFICINDGSTDNSLDILLWYAEKDSRIKVVNKENEGYGKTMNRGLDMASSPWIGIVESDDFVKADMYEILYKSVKGSQADFVKCNFYKYKAKDGKNIDYSREYPQRLLGKEICPVEEPEVFDAHSSIWAGIYRKSFLDSNLIRFHETSGASYQDISFHFKILSSANRMKLIEDALIYYRIDNIHSSVYNPDKVFCISDEMHFIEEYIQKQSNERQKQLWPIFMRKKFYDYRWNYFRLAPEFQFAFLKVMSEEFKIDWKEGKFDRIKWNLESNKDELNEIIENPILFFERTKNRNYIDERIQVADTSNRKIFLKGLLKEIEETEKTVIYGAGVWGKWVAERLLEKGIPKSKLVFGVTHKELEVECMDITIKEIKQLISGKNNLLVILAAKGKNQIEMLGNLQKLMFENVVIVDDEFTEAMNYVIE